jgi:hypothetical protein
MKKGLSSLKVLNLANRIAPSKGIRPRIKKSQNSICFSTNNKDNELTEKTITAGAIPKVIRSAKESS